MILSTCKEIINERRSVRSFTNEKISEEELLDILDCGRQAPSSKNYQPWRFYILNDEEKRNLYDMMMDTLNKNNTEKTGLATAKILNDAGQVVVVYADRETLKAKDSGMYSLMLSVGACIENMLLRATELGVATLWMYDVVVVAKELEEMYCPDGMFVSAICFGKEDKVLPRAKKKDLKDLIVNK